MKVVKEQIWTCECAFCRATLLVSSGDINTTITSSHDHSKGSVVKQDGISYYRYYKCGVCGQENEFTADVLTR